MSCYIELTRLPINTARRAAEDEVELLVGTASGSRSGAGRTASASAARTEMREHIDLFSTAAARALYRAPQDEGECWADLHLSDGSVRPCGEPEATSLGLCATHRAELLGPDAR